MIETLIAASSAVTTIVTVSCTDINTLVDRARVYPDISEKDRQEIISDINIEEKKVIDITRLTDDDLNTIERMLKYAVVDSSEGGENEKVSQVLHQRSLGHNRT